MSYFAPLSFLLFSKTHTHGAPQIQSSPFLSVVIPAFNEQVRLPPTLDECTNYLNRKWPGRYELIVADDGSTDDTVLTVVNRGLCHSLRMVSSTRGNNGKGAAVAAGAAVARGDLILLMDADGATDIRCIEKLRSAMSDSRAHLAIGSRTFVARPILRRFMGNVFSLLASSVVVDVCDTQCGFKLLTREAASLLPQLRLKGWAFDVELLGVAQALGMHIETVPVTWRDVEGSKVGILAPISMALDIAVLFFMYRGGLWSLPTPGLRPIKPPYYREVILRND